MTTDRNRDESFTPEVVVEMSPGAELMRLTAVPEISTGTGTAPTGAYLAALSQIAESTPAMLRVIQEASARGKALQVVFPPAVVSGLRDGSLRLMQAADGAIPVAIDKSGTIVKQARVVSDIGKGVTVATLAGAALPLVIASAATYAQQRQLERSLASIKAVVERIEARLEDADTGQADASEAFLDLVGVAVGEGGMSPYLRMELAAQRTAVEALYFSRRRWVGRFKAELERDQIEREKSKGQGQPWVDFVIDAVKDGKLEQELILFIRLLLSRTKLGVLAARVLAEDGSGQASLELLMQVETELRREFFDLHNRLSPLARIAPEANLMQRLPGVQRIPGLGGAVARAHESITLLVDHLNRHVLPVIPDPHNEREVVAVLDAPTVRHLAAVA
jgi:hypothetical protein